LIQVYYYINLMAFFQDNLDKPAPEKQNLLDFSEARDDGVAVASAGPYANHLHHAPDNMPVPHHSVFTGRMPFLYSNRVKALNAFISIVSVNLSMF